ncbi:MAG: glucose-1-phosphate adenylyltransferase [Deltaproteobacteria bacterium]|nr:glucose-1-phosphate adenylyltransferase [Candidatus Tharpella aukensis]
MLNDLLAVVLAGGEGKRLSPLTRDRAKPAVPFAGQYRIIDFTLSNCLNSHIRKIIVLTQYKSGSASRHLAAGWSIFNPELGEFIYEIPPQMRVGERWYEGTADAIYQNLYSLEVIRPKYILVLAGDHIYKMDYGKMLAFHQANNAALTISAITVNRQEATGLGILEVDEKQQVIGFQEKPKEPKGIPGQPDKAYASMGIYIFEFEKLKKLLEADAADPDSSHDFGKDIIPALYPKERVFAYPFGSGETREDASYWRDVGTIDAYWEANINLSGVDPEFNLYDSQWPLRTYQSQMPPAKFVFANVREKRVGRALDSLVCNGVIISGGLVERSVLSPGVRINSFAQVHESILMHQVEIGRKSRIRKTIIDKGVRIPPNTEIGYDLEKDRQRFPVSPGGVVVVPKGTVF